jgi:hypothetical protein
MGRIGPTSKCHFGGTRGKGGKTGETGEEFDLLNHSMLTGLTGLADRTVCHVERPADSGGAIGRDTDSAFYWS